MYLENIEDRIKRIYSSIGQRLDLDFKKHIKIEHRVDGKHGQVEISFDKEDKSFAQNDIILIIASIARLKDYLKKLCKAKGHTPDDIEGEINDSQYLQLIIDLDNRDKHGSSKPSRSGKYPYIDNVQRVLTTRTKDQKGIFDIDPFSGKFNVSKNVVIKTIAEVKAKDGELICGFDELINNAMEKWEEVINKYNLITNKN